MVVLATFHVCWQDSQLKQPQAALQVDESYLHGQQNNNKQDWTIVKLALGTISSSLGSISYTPQVYFNPQALKKINKNKNKRLLNCAVTHCIPQNHRLVSGPKYITYTPNNSDEWNELNTEIATEAQRSIEMPIDCKNSQQTPQFTNDQPVWRQKDSLWSCKFHSPGSYS